MPIEITPITLVTIEDLAEQYAKLRITLAETRDTHQMPWQARQLLSGAIATARQGQNACLQALEMLDADVAAKARMRIRDILKGSAEAGQHSEWKAAQFQSAIDRSDRDDRLIRAAADAARKTDDQG